MMNKIFNQRVVLSLLNLCLILILVIGVVAQNSTTSSSASAASSGSGGGGGVYGKDNFGSLFDGSLDFKLPLVSIGGRGSVNFSPVLRIQQGMWKYDAAYQEANPYDPYPQARLTVDLKYEEKISSDSPYVGLNPGVAVFKREKGSGNTLTRIYFYQNGGGRLELIDSTYKGKPTSFGYGGYRGQTFISHDGSATTFISDTNVRDIYQTGSITQQDPGGYPSGYLKFANGITYRIDNGAVSWTRDINGNTMQFTYFSGVLVGTDITPGKIKTATDANGRTVDFDYAIQDNLGLYDKVTYKGFGGASRFIRIFKKPLAEVLKSGDVLKSPMELFPSFGDDIDQCDEGPEYQPVFCVYGSSNRYAIFNPTVISSVSYPDGSNYQLKYNSYGELARVEYPTDGATEYVHGKRNNSNADIGGLEYHQHLLQGYPPQRDESPTYIHRGLKEVLTYREGNILEKRKTLDIQNVAGNTETVSETFDGQSVKLLSSKYYFNGYSSPISGGGDFSYLDWRQGREYKNETLSPTSGEVLNRNETDWDKGGFYLWQVQTWGNQGLEFDPRVVETRTIDVPNNLVTKTTYSYDQFNNVTDTYSYDLGVGQAGQFLKRSHTDYVTSSNYTSDAVHLKKLPVQSWTSSDINGTNKVALAQFEYDDYSEYLLVDRQNVVGHETANYGTTKTLRGNVTKTTSYTDAQNQTGAIIRKTQYDILGNTVKSIDAKGNASTIDYADRFGSPNGEARSNSAPSQLNGLKTFAFATSATDVLGYTAYSQVDYWTGLNVNTEDINGIISKSFYNDQLDRPTQTVSAVGTTKEIQSNIVYDDEHRRIETKSDLFLLNDNLTKSETFYDSLGRTFETRRYENGGYIVSKTEFDVLGRTKRVTNPYRPWQNETPVWTENFYDDLGRTIKTKTSDNAEVLTEYAGTSITVTDQSGRKRRSISNAQGVIRVDEPDEQGELGDVTNPNQPTYYQYNTLGNLVKVTQGNQNRYFLYNSIGQLIRVRQPEQGTNSSLAKVDPITGNNDWSTGLSYDVTGEILTTTDAKGITTTNTYDISTRPLTTTYSDNTPAISYVYDDVNIPNSKSRLTKITNGISTTEYTSFDNFGRLLTQKQTTDGNVYTIGYKYNLRGEITEQTYPSGRVVKTTLDSNGSVASVESQKNAQSSFMKYASQFVYNSTGAIASMRLGNGLFETTKYNKRLQITELGLGNSTSTTNLWKINYDYGTTDNNGNIKSQTIATGSAVFSQSYQYDGLNRLTEAKEVSNSIETWKQTFGYDRFGNRTQFSQVIENQQLTINSQTLPQVDIANNRFTTGQGYEYDLNGNIIKDTQNRQFIFDGNNKQTEVKNANNQVIGNYFYDGKGSRVKKVTATETIIFVYNAAKQLVAEYSTQVNSNPQITYLTTDNLRTPRIKTNSQGQVISRNDYMPFGEDLSTSQRNQNSGYKQDSVSQSFTGYQEDSETGLNFAKARYQSPGLGRFTSVDPLLASGKSGNPQTFNRYVYCLNRPLIAIDSDGLSTIIVLVYSDKTSLTMLFDNNGRLYSEYRSLAAGTKEGRSTKGEGDAPFGIYKFTGVLGGKKGKAAVNQKDAAGFGTGIIKLKPVAGEAITYNRDGIYLHGGGSRSKDPYGNNVGPDGKLLPTHGCIRHSNDDINKLIKDVNQLEKQGDKLDRVAIADNDYLKDILNQKDSKGNYLYPDVRKAYYADNLQSTNQSTQPSTQANNEVAGPELKFTYNDGTEVYDGPMDDDEDDAIESNQDFKFGGFGEDDYDPG
jgi:RHS repeat-associated protein